MLGRFRGAKSKAKGDALEKRVERLFRLLLKLNVQRNIVLKDKNGNISQIDVTYGLFPRRYVECKNYNHPVPFEDVAKFKEVLQLNGISPRRGLFITTATYTPRCSTIGVKTWDGRQLRRREALAPLIALTKVAFLGGCVWTARAVYDDYQSSKHASFGAYLQNQKFLKERVFSHPLYKQHVRNNRYLKEYYFENATVRRWKREVRQTYRAWEHQAWKYYKKLQDMFK